ncbi:hypothetical protein C8R45DRAFT_1107897 [Mycena sanguinolenta]|nr:hypothetical protein C8R45DRAFT_1107897 [Mycena sanguinolenta]
MHLHDPFHPPPAPPGFGLHKTVPQSTASFLDQLSAFWLGPFFKVGFSRPLEKMGAFLAPLVLTANATDALEADFYPRWPPEVRPEVRPKAYRGESATAAAGATGRRSGSVTASETVEGAAQRSKGAEPTKDADGAKAKPRRWSRKKDKKPKPEFDSSLFKAVHRTCFWRIWFGGVLKLGGGAPPSPSLSAYVLYHAELAGVKMQGIGYGVGLGGRVVRDVGGIKLDDQPLAADHGNNLPLRAHPAHAPCKDRAHRGPDDDHLDGFGALESVCFFGHNIWTSPIQMIISVGLLINNICPPRSTPFFETSLTRRRRAARVLRARRTRRAPPGFPLHMLLVRVMFVQCKKGVKITDTRVRLSNEVLQGIRLIKYYAWESFYTHQIGSLREREIATVQKTTIARAALIALVTLIPVLASITYALSGHDLNIAIIFTHSLYIVTLMPAHRSSAPHCSSSPSSSPRSPTLPRDGEPPDPVADAKFSLDSTIGDEALERTAAGTMSRSCQEQRNHCLGRGHQQRRDGREAAADHPERVCVPSATLLCIAHRLNTIAYYDRILVMDKGEVAEFDTVLNLFDKEDSIFRSLCNEANLQRADILRIRAENAIDTATKS